MPKELEQLLASDANIWSFETEYLLGLATTQIMPDLIVQLESENKGNFWVPYLKTHITFAEERKLAKIEAANLGNIFAMYECVQIYDDDTENIEYLEKAMQAGYPIAIFHYIINYLLEDSNICDIAEDAKEWSLEKKDQVRDRTLEDLKKFPNLQDLQGAGKLDWQVQYKEITSKIYGHISTIYNILGLIYGDDRYRDEILYYNSYVPHPSLYTENELRHWVQVLSRRNYERKMKLEKLEQAYEELKKIKEMDFNNIVSNSVGGYL